MPTDPAKPPPQLIHVIVGTLICPECLARLDPVLEERAQRFNPARVWCVQPACKNFHIVFKAPTIKIVPE